MKRAYDKVLLAIAILVAGVWAISIIVQTIFPDRQPPDSVNQVMIIVATGLFGGSVLASIKRNGKDDE